MPRLKRPLLAAGVTLFALLAAVADVPAQPAPPQQQRIPGQVQPSGPPSAPTPLAVPSVLSTSPPPSAPLSTATPVPTNAVTLPAGANSNLRFTGQLLDLRNGYVYLTTADAFKANPALRIINLDPGERDVLKPVPRLYARLTIDATSRTVVELALTKRRLATDSAYQAAYAQARAYASTGSPIVVAPELLHGQRLTGRPVAVTFYVQVPPTTPLSDDVYITTDASGWVPNAMKMDRIDALHYRLTRTYASGTKFAYRYTRGTWTSVEVGEDGLQDDPHQFFVPEVDAKRLTDLIYRWSDEKASQPEAGPNSVPTPFNPNPFGNLPSTIQHPGVPAPSPTPRP